MANAEPGENDIYIGLCACETKTEMNAVLNFKRVFLAGFDKTDFWKNITSAVDDFTARGYDVRDMYATLQSVWNY
ncbi:hypothetical protein NK983_32905, partial [Salmonella enterica subsp. enterica serovar Typhimurium]|nr:hypothetical protein [Salmonella enterica subsp. enterica serovar Typhimurium]